MIRSHGNASARLRSTCWRIYSNWAHWSWERVMKNNKNLGFDAFAILSFFLVKCDIWSVQNLGMTLWFVELFCALVPVWLMCQRLLTENSLNTQCVKMVLRWANVRTSCNRALLCVGYILKISKRFQKPLLLPYRGYSALLHIFK